MKPAGWIVLACIAAFFITLALYQSGSSTDHQAQQQELRIGDEAVISADSLGAKDKDVDFNAYLDADKANDAAGKYDLLLQHRIYIFKAGERVLVIGTSGYPISAKHVRPLQGDRQSETFWVDAKRVARR